MGFAFVLAVSLATGAIAFATLDAIFSEERRVRTRLDKITAFTAEQVSEAEPLAMPFRTRVLLPSLGVAGRALRSAMPVDYRARLQTKITEAGHPANFDADRFFLTKIVASPVAFGFTFGLARTMTRTSAGRALLASAACAILFFYLPDLIVRAAAEKRRRLIVRELPDMLDMLTISVEAGLGFDQAVSRYVQHSSGPLGKEFGITLMEIQAGKSRREALRAMGDRTKVPELRAFIMAIVQADVFGVSVADVLRTQSREMRVKRRQMAEELAQKAPAKMAFPLIIFILPATIIVVITPAVIGLMRLLG